MSQINTFYFNKNENFGDQLNVELLKNLFNIDAIYSIPNQAKLVAIGSLLESFLHGSSDYRLFFKKLILPKVHVWGSGFIDDVNRKVLRPNSKTETFGKRIEIHALRGLKSKKRAERILNASLDNIALGDPGILAGKLLTKSTINKKYKVGIIPHYVDSLNPLVNNLKESIPNSTTIDILSPVYSFLEKISECETIISSAMHGLIAADSLGIPNCRAIFSDNITGGDYKFDDYYSSYNLTGHHKIDLRKNKVIHQSDIISNYIITNDQVEKKQEQLINSFPF